ncbi:MAG TPA: hypothetical protein VK169_14680 [Saprospiraceae bacterium]|nr:hypothetical protein [Saprospiraceae bacterium]
MKDKNKFEFIIDLLNKKSIPSNYKEKIFHLISNELAVVNYHDTTMLERIEKIEQKINNLKNESSYDEQYNKDEKKEEQKLNVLHKPKQTFELLSSFSSHDGGIKNLTHAFNYGYIEYEELIKNCKEEFDKGKLKYPNAPIALLTRIEQFAFSDSPKWYFMRGEEKIWKSLGWSEPTFVYWYKEKKIHPSNDAFYSSEMIKPFKETIQVRSDLGNLIKLIQELTTITFNKSVNVTINESVLAAQFYTDVDRLGLAIYHIFMAIKNASDKNFLDEVEIKFKIQDNIKLLEFCHIDSTPTKSVHDYDFLGGDLNSAKNYLWSLCNYDIIAKFKEGTFRKVILSDKNGEMEKSESGKWIGKYFPVNADIIKGFTHILKFY